MSHTKSQEVALAIKITKDLLKALDALRAAWKHHETRGDSLRSCLPT